MTTDTTEDARLAQAVTEARTRLIYDGVAGSSQRLMESNAAAFEAALIDYREAR